MSYNLDVFLMTLLVFYIFLVILMFFHNFPFSAKPQHLFGVVKRRFFSHAEALNTLQVKEKRTYFEELQLKYHQNHLKINVKKLQLWGSKIDTDYFHLIDAEQIVAFTDSCEAYLKHQKNIQSCYNSENEINWQSLKVNKF